MQTSDSQDGLSILDKFKKNRRLQIITAIVVVLLLLGLIYIWTNQSHDKPKNNKSENTSTQNNKSDESTKSEPIRWAYNQQTLEWFTPGKPTTCKDPFMFDRSPVDLSKIMVIGMPGQYRGYNYKPHAGLRLSDPNSGKVDIVMPTDATLVSLTRYYEGNPAEIQYLLTFETDCGIAFRFDHLFTLSPAFQAIAETTPEPKLDDTRSDPSAPFKRTNFKAGDLVATEIGHPATKNFGFDFGTYDYRHRNAIASNAKWTQIHNQYQATEWHGTCWLDQLPGADAAKAKELAFVVINPSKPNIISDYCTYAPHKTLDFNDGQPTDG